MTSALAVVTRRPGTGVTSGSGRNRSRSTPTGTMAMRSGSTLWSRAMSLNEFSDTVTTRVMPLGHLGLHVGERVPAAQRQALVPALGVLDLEAAVDGDRVVDRAEHREPVALDGQQAVAEALVVVDEVEVAGAAVEVVPRPQGEGEGLGERAERERGDLDEVGPVLQLPQAGHPHREVVVVDVEAGQLDQRDPRVELGVGLAAQHLDVVAEVDERLGEVAGVDALATDVGLAPVGEQRDAQRRVVGVHSRNLSVPLTAAVNSASARALPAVRWGSRGWARVGRTI